MKVRVPRASWNEQFLARIRYLENFIEWIKHDHRNRLQEADRDFLEKARYQLAEARFKATAATPELTWSNVHAAEVTLLKFFRGARLLSKATQILALANKRLGPDDPRTAALKEAIKPLKHLHKKDRAAWRARPIMQREAPNNRAAWRARPTMQGEAPNDKLTKTKAVGLRRQVWLLENRVREAAVTALSAAYLAEDNWHLRVRSQRNALFAVAALAATAAVALGLWGALSPDAISTCFGPKVGEQICPSSAFTYSQDNGTIQYRAPTRQDVFLVEIFGMVGAFLTVVAALRKVRGTALPYELNRAALWVKLPTGALTALAGITLIRSGFIPGLTELDTGAQIVGWSLVFGASQYVVTQYVDQRVVATLNE